MSALGSLFTEDFYEKAENILNFYLDSNWEFGFIGVAQAPSYKCWALSLLLSERAL